jgi:Flp pilus assembly protein CpaB
MSTASQAARAWRSGFVPHHVRRRLLAAGLAAAGVLIAISSLKPAAHVPGRSAAPTTLASRLHARQVAAPVRLVDPGVASLLHSGDVVDVLTAPESPTGSADATTQALAGVVAQHVRILAVTPSSGDSSLGTLVVLAVTPSDAQALAGAEAGGRLSVVLERS